MHSGDVAAKIMYIPETTINKHGYITYSESFCDELYSTKVEVGTTGTVGGDSSRSFFKITIDNGACIEFEKNENKDGSFGVSCDFNGDWEFEMIHSALRFIVHVLDAQKNANTRREQEKKDV